MSEPRTAAGRAVAAWSESDADLLDKYGFRTLRQAVHAIEAEARRDAVTDAAQDWMRRAAEKKVAEAAAPASPDVVEALTDAMSAGFDRWRERWGRDAKALMPPLVIEELTARGYRLVPASPEPPARTRGEGMRDEYHKPGQHPNCSYERCGHLPTRRTPASAASDPESPAEYKSMGEFAKAFGASSVNPFADRIVVVSDTPPSEARAAVPPAIPDVVEALEAAEFALNITVAAESDDRSWYDEACEALETVRAALSYAEGETDRG